jgi:hypothetical protein
MRGGAGKVERLARDKLKTDQRDAERVRRLLMIDGLHAVRVPPVEADPIRDLVRPPEDLRSVIDSVRRPMVRLPPAPQEPRRARSRRNRNSTTTRRGVTDAT